MNPTDKPYIEKDLSFSQDRIYHVLLYATFIGSILIYFWSIWAIPTLSHNEARRMIVVQEMLTRHNWLIPTINNEIYIEKPPLFYWLAIPFVLLFRSTAEWVIRLPSALSAFALTWLLFFHVRRYFDRWSALFSALLLTTSFYFSESARVAELPMVLTACCCCALLFYFDCLQNNEKKRYLYLAYIFMGLAFLTKGPVSLIFILCPILVFGFFPKNRHAIKGLIFLPGWTVFILIAFPWYLYVIFSLGKGPLEGVIQRDIFHKIVGTSDSAPFYQYILVLIGSFSPWVLVLFHRTKSQFKRLFTERDTAYFAFSFTVPMIIMSLFSARESNYIVPVLPVTAVFIGIWVKDYFNHIYKAGRHKLFRRLAWGIVLFMAFPFLYYAMVQPRIKKYKFEAFQPIISKIHEAPQDTPVYSYKQLYYQLIYYYGQPIPNIDMQKINNMISARKSFLLIVQDRYWGQLNGLDFRVLIEYRPFINKHRSVRMLAFPG